MFAAVLGMSPAGAQNSDAAPAAKSVEDQWRSAPTLHQGWPHASEQTCREYGIAYNYSECAVYQRKGAQPQAANPPADKRSAEHGAGIQKVAVPERRGTPPVMVAPAQPALQAAVPQITPIPASAPMILVEFTGQQRDDEGVRDVKALISSGLISGVVIRPENVVSSRQLAELILFLSSDQPSFEPLFAVRQIVRGADVVVLPIGFPAYPDARIVGADNDPERAYEAYADIARYWADAGIGMVIPAPGQISGVDFGIDPRHIAAFLKSKLLAHRDSGVAFIAPMELPQTAYAEALARLRGRAELPAVITSALPEQVQDVPRRVFLDLSERAQIDMASLGALHDQADIVILGADMVPGLAPAGHAPADLEKRRRQILTLRNDLGIALPSVTSGLIIRNLN